MKKLLSMVLALMLCLTAVSALAETTLKLGIYPEETEQVQIDSHEAWIAAFEEKYPDVTVERAHYKYATDTFVPMADAVTVPTIFESWFTEPGKLIAGGFVADITDELNERGWVEKMNPNILSLLSDDEGHVYSIPRDAYALGLMINAEVFEDAGLVDEDGIPTYPKTWDEVLEYGKIIKEETGSAALCLLAKDAAGGWHFSNIAWCFGAEFEDQDENGKWIAQVNSPEAIEAMEFVQTMYKEGNLKLEEPQLAQELYAELTKVLQEVVTNPDADVAALMETANTNFQAILDEKVNG